MGDRLGIHSAVDILYSNLLLIVPNTVRLWWHNTTWYIPLKIQCKSITIRLSSALNKDRLCYIDTTHPVTHLLKKVNQAYMLGRLDKWCSESISQRIKDKVSALAEISCKKIYQQENIHILTSPPPPVGRVWLPTFQSSPALLVCWTSFNVYGHITLNTPVLVWSLQLSKVELC